MLLTNVLVQKNTLGTKTTNVMQRSVRGITG